MMNSDRYGKKTRGAALALHAERFPFFGGILAWSAAACFGKCG
jgi:hypothetical protein